MTTGVAEARKLVVDALRLDEGFLALYTVHRDFERRIVDAQRAALSDDGQERRERAARCKGDAVAADCAALELHNRG